jgi:transcriptional regulator with XRE-family HTH domain
MSFSITQGITVKLQEDLNEKVQASGFTMSAVCRRAGVSSGTVTHWLAGRATPNQTTYDRLIAALTELVAERESEMRRAGVSVYQLSK